MGGGLDDVVAGMAVSGQGQRPLGLVVGVAGQGDGDRHFGALQLGPFCFGGGLGLRFGAVGFSECVGLASLPSDNRLLVWHLGTLPVGLDLTHPGPPFDRALDKDTFGSGVQGQCRPCLSAGGGGRIFRDDDQAVIVQLGHGVQWSGEAG